MSDNERNREHLEDQNRRGGTTSAIVEVSSCASDDEHDNEGDDGPGKDSHDANENGGSQNEVRRTNGEGEKSNNYNEDTGEEGYRQQGNNCLAYASPQQMVDPNMSTMGNAPQLQFPHHPHNNSYQAGPPHPQMGPSPFGPFPPHGPTHQPFPMNNMLQPPMLPPNLPIPPSLPPMNLPSNNNLDAARQYYEAQMREHAMQYANAAAGAAWAAARIAYGDFGGSGTGYPSLLSPTASEFSSSGPAPTSSRPQRTLWTPPSSDQPKSKIKGKSEKSTSGENNACSKGGNYDSASSGSRLSSRPSNPAPQQGKKRSKKSGGGGESGNDSVSSFGSGGGGGGSGRGNCNKQLCKKGNQRRRFNEEEDKNESRISGKKEGKQRSTNDASESNNESNPRHKRGWHGSSTKGPPSPGSNVQQPIIGRNKKKNRMQTHQESPSSSSGGVHFFPASSSPHNNTNNNVSSLIGKSGVSALYELCSKYKWEMPRYTLTEPQRLTSPSNSENNTTGITHYNTQDFVLSVEVNGVELGRGRGCSKALAKQDASRKALSKLIPGAIFCPNGILLDVGSRLTRRSSGNVRSPTSLEELTPHLASQLAIAGNINNASTGVRTRPSSPDPSEDSSISTAVSMTKVSGNDGEGVISGGPLQSKVGSRQPTRPFLSSNIYPCASTSGVSSASEVDDDQDENAYYASRGASVCSTLLHAMVQIDPRIREAPFYEFDICSSPVNSSSPIVSSGNGKSKGAASSKRKASSTEVTAHRLPFQCTATLTLSFPKSLVNNKGSSSILECWESPLEYIQNRDIFSSAKDELSQEVSRKRKDSQGGSPSPTRRQDREEAATKEVENEEFVTHKLESLGTGSTKRESKHKASAKMLQLLFPECTSMVEVKAAAEAARECYAANKAMAYQTKRAKLAASEMTCNGGLEFSPSREATLEKNENKCRDINSFLPEENETPLTADNVRHITHLSKEKFDEQRKADRDRGSACDNFVSVAGLSLSEQPDEKVTTSTDPSFNNMSSNSVDLLEHQHDFEREIDDVLHSFQDLDEDGRCGVRDYSIDDVGKIILRRAQPEDIEYVQALLSKKNPTTSNGQTFKKKRFPNVNNSVVEPFGLVSSRHQSNDADTDNEDVEKLACHNWGNSAIILLLSRAVATQEPLGCALLNLGFSLTLGRVLTVCDIGHEEHLPRERFIECLESFARKMNCTLRSDDNLGNNRTVLSSSEICDIVQHYASSKREDSTNDCFDQRDHNQHDRKSEFKEESHHHHQSNIHAEDCYVDRVQGNSLHALLQSVKEEESEEVEEGSDDEERKERLTESSALIGGKQCKPSKRTRTR